MVFESKLGRLPEKMYEWRTGEHEVYMWWWEMRVRAASAAAGIGVSDTVSASVACEKGGPRAF